MKKILMFSIGAMLSFGACKKATQDIKPASDSATDAVVTPMPLTAKFTFTVQDPINIFENQVIKFNNLSTGASSYQWEFGNTIKSQEKEPSMSYQMHGYYTVKLTATDATGNIKTYTQDFSILCLFYSGVHPTPGAGGY